MSLSVVQIQWAWVVLASTVAACGGREELVAQVPRSIEKIADSLLRPLADETVVISSKQWDRYQRTAIIFRARRQPPSASGEDGRIARVAIVAARSDTAIISQAADLEAAWRLVGPSRGLDSAEVAEAAWALADDTGLLTGYLLRSASDVTRATVANLFRDSTALRRVTPPVVERRGDQLVARLYSVERAGIFENLFAFDSHGAFTVQRVLVAEYLMRM